MHYHNITAAVITTMDYSRLRTLHENDNGQQEVN